MVITCNDDDDANPRPHKRPRPSSSSLMSPPSSTASFVPLPSSALLLALPSLLIHPPTHKRHWQSISLAQHALRRCLDLPGLDCATECRAWTALAELGLGCLHVGIHSVQGEVEKAITKAVRILLFVKHSLAHLISPQLLIAQKVSRFFLVLSI